MLNIFHILIFWASIFVALTGHDPVGAAIGSVVGETAAEALHKEGKDPATTATQARIIGDTVAFVAGRDVASADSAGRTAVENNSLMHPETSMKISMTVQDESLSEEERAQKIEAAIEEGKAQDEIYVATMGFAAAPGITSGYYATQSAARWAGTYAGGGIQAVKQEFRDHPIASTVDVATAGLLGAGFVKSMTKVPQLVEAGQRIKISQPLTQTELPVIAPSKPQQLEFGFVQEGKQMPTVSETVVDTGKRWTKTIEFKGTASHQQDSIIDPLRRSPKTGETSYELMLKGKAPIGPDGEPLHLHHVLQEEGPLVELTKSMHEKYYPVIHMFSKDKTFRSTIDRSKFKTFKKEYWKERAKDFEEVMKNAK